MQVDAELAPHLEGAGDRRIGDLARKIGYRLDPGAALRRNQKAEADRRVTIRPAPDTMSNVTALLPVAQGVAAYAALRKHAESLRAQGDPRTHRADHGRHLLRPAHRAGGRRRRRGDRAGDDRPDAASAADHEPAHVPGYGSIPAFLARRIVHEADRGLGPPPLHRPRRRRARRDGQQAPHLPRQAAQALVLRDQTCRTPWCDAPIAHVDHVRSSPARRRHHGRQRPGAVCGVQLHQGGARLARRPRHSGRAPRSGSPRRPATTTDRTHRRSRATHRR